MLGAYFFERGKAGLYRVIPAMTRDLSLHGLVWRTTTFNHLWTSQGSWGYILTQVFTGFDFMKFVQLEVTICNHFAIHSSKQQFRNTLNFLVAVRVTTSSPPPFRSISKMVYSFKSYANNLKVRCSNSKMSSFVTNFQYLTGLFGFIFRAYFRNLEDVFCPDYAIFKKKFFYELT